MAAAKKSKYPKWVLDDLARSGIDAKAAVRLGIDALDEYAATSEIVTAYREAGFEKAGAYVGASVPAAYRIPYRHLQGKRFVHYRLRFQTPWAPVGAGDRKPARYWQPPGSMNRIYLPPGIDWRKVARDPRIGVVIVEGEKKAVAISALGIAAIALGGVDSWRARYRGKGEPSEPLADFGAFAWAARKVEICYDSDLRTKPPVAAAQGALARFLVALGARPHAIDLPAALPGVAKVGADDFLVHHGAKARAAWDALPRRALNVFDRDRTRLNLRDPAPEPPFIVEGYLPLGTVGGLPAEGGVGKTTFTLWEAAHLVLGLPLYGLKVERPGTVVFLTGEDEAPIYRYRLQAIARALGLSKPDLKRLEDGIHVVDVVGDLRRLVEADAHGNLIATPFVDEIIAAFLDRGVVLINVDPMIHFGPGERFVNDAEAALLTVGARIARELNCAVRFVHHISKFVARSRIVDQYAGRGGAAFVDNARFQHTLVVHAVSENDKYPPPQLADAADNAALKAAIEAGDVIRLHTTKISWRKRLRETIWLWRVGYRFRVVRDELARSRTERREAQDAEAGKKIVAYVRQKLAENTKLSRDDLTEDHREMFDLKRDAMRRVVRALIATGRLVYTDLPEAERKGARKTYLAPGAEPPTEGPAA